jgi:hypothetical protein
VGIPLMAGEFHRWRVYLTTAHNLVPEWIIVMAATVDPGDITDGSRGSQVVFVGEVPSAGAGYGA